MHGPGRVFGGLGARTPPPVLAILLSAVAILGQDKPSTPSEVASHDTEPQFKFEVQRNLVLVRVVVRNTKGQPVGGLHKADFRLLDNRKPQTIINFTEETPHVKPREEAKVEQQAPDQEDSPPPAFTPLRFLALYFDDVHDNFDDLSRARDAADRYLSHSLRPGDRAGVFTSSGQGIRDFTDDLGTVHEALFHLQPRPIIREELNPCPQIFAYQAFLMVDRRDAP